MKVIRSLNLPDRLRLGLDVSILFLFAATAIGALEYRRLARYFPFWLSVFFALLALINVLNDLRVIRVHGELIRGDAIDSASMSIHGGATPSEALRITTLYMGWVVAYVVLIYIIGMPLATVIFLLAWLRFVTKAALWPTVLSIAAILAVLFAVTEVLGFRWPHSIFEPIR